ncbi:F420-non-reducing hydrogenase vhu subunit A [Striga asiatica]|uniref:F420-non-reducing hydrogenase vhu subunit A n=1 Tax=Striga asiatica TaxID=4170 RepID=A0A5A7QLL8_STRAF|nr:F420-non-reducing hydrogenase vhu subunit A [Striga asiatica]
MEVRSRFSEAYGWLLIYRRGKVLVIDPPRGTLYISLCSVSLYYRIGMYSPTWGLLAWKGGIIANPFKVLQEGTKLGNKAHSKVLSFFTFPSSGFGIILLGIYEIEYGAHLVISFEGSPQYRKQEVNHCRVNGRVLDRGFCPGEPDTIPPDQSKSMRGQRRDEN